MRPIKSQISGRCLPAAGSLGVVVLFLAQTVAPAQEPTNTLVAPAIMETIDFSMGAGTLASPLRMQEVYGAAHFPVEAILISELRYRPDYLLGKAFTSRVERIEIRLSTTARPSESLSNVFAENIGADETVVFNGPLEISSAFSGPTNGPKAFDIVIPLTNQFFYVPAFGNLLVDIRNYSGSGASKLSGRNSTGDSASRVFGGVTDLTGYADHAVDALQIVYAPTTPPPLPPPLVLRGPYLQRGTTSNMVVRWRTSRATDSTVRFGLDAGDLPWQVSDVAPKTEHILTLTNLSPDTRYYYAVWGSQTNLTEGPDYHFRTAPVAGRPTRIWTIGDAGTAHLAGYQGLAAKVRDAYLAYTGPRETDVWIMLGDNTYWSGTDEEYQGGLFDAFPEQLRRMPFWPCLGNHDVNFQDGFPAMRMVTLPMQGEAGGAPSGSPYYYSFNYGNIHFVSLDSQVVPRLAGSPMLEWLQQDLAANTNEWTIAFWHGPPYTAGTHNSDLVADQGHMVEMRENVVPILEAYGVDLVLSGHSHNYERSYLIDSHYGYSSTFAPEMVKDSGDGREEGTGAYRKPGHGPQPHQGAVYVVAGSSGFTFGGWYPNQHPAMLTRGWVMGSMVIDVDGSRLDARFLRETGKIDDHFTILKGASPEQIRWASFRLNGGMVRAQWKSEAGKTYQVEQAADLTNPVWEPIGQAITAFGATTGWTNTVPAGGPNRFFRVSLRGTP